LTGFAIGKAQRDDDHEDHEGWMRIRTTHDWSHLPLSTITEVGQRIESFGNSRTCAHRDHQIRPRRRRTERDDGPWRDRGMGTHGVGMVMILRSSSPHELAGAEPPSFVVGKMAGQGWFPVPASIVRELSREKYRGPAGLVDELFGVEGGYYVKNGESLVEPVHRLKTLKKDAQGLEAAFREGLNP